MNKSEHTEETIVACRIPKNYVIPLDRLIDDRGLWTRSDVIRQAIKDYLLKTKAIWAQAQPEPPVNPTEPEDAVSKGIKELMALQHK